jgi:hypothetical protein
MKGQARRRGFLSALTGVVVGASGCLGGSSTESPQSPRPQTPPTIGNAEAGILVEEFSDIEAERVQGYYLSHFRPLHDQFISEGHIAYRFHSIPIPISEFSTAFAHAFWSVYWQADAEKAVVFLDNILTADDGRSQEVIKFVAQELEDVSKETVVRHIEDEEFKQEIAGGRERANAVGVGTDPTLSITVDGEEVKPRIQKITDAFVY